MKKKRYALVDADMLTYMAGFAVQKKNYTGVWFDYSDIPHQEIFRSAKELKEWKLANPDLRLRDEEEMFLVEPVENALQIVKMKLQEMRQFGILEVYLKGDGENWRNKVATLYPYKGNRTSPPPVWYHAIREYMVDHWGATLINGKEVDDHIATLAYERRGQELTICHADKDLDQIPGHHWNYNTSVRYYVEEIDALCFFYEQILSGDYSDNVKGCWKIGKGRAVELVNECLERADETHEDLETLLWSKVVQEYEDSMGRNGCPYAGMPPEQVALENARLVWMQTEPNRLWTPPGWEEVYLSGGLDD